MKITKFLLPLLMAAIPIAVSAQQPMPGMPGMEGDAPQSKRQENVPPTKPNRTKQQPHAMPGDMGGMQHDPSNSRAKAAGTSEQNSVNQQSEQGSAKPGMMSDSDSETVPVQDVQEPEAIELHTGSDLPAPELLGDVVKQNPMTLADFIALADKANPTLRQAQANAERSRQQGRQIGLPPDPVIGYSGDHIRGGSYHGGEEGAFFSQEIVLGRKLALRRDIYRAQGKANDLGVEIQRARVHNDVTKAFFDTLAAQASVVVHDRLLKVASDAETNSHELERIGQADASDVLKAEVAAEQTRIEFVDAQRNFLAAFQQLATYAGQHALQPHPLMGSLTDPPQLDAEAIVHADMEESPAVRQAQANIETADVRVKSAKREKVPNLSVKAGEWYSGEELSDADGKKTGWMSFAEIGVNLPIWNRNQGNVAAAKVVADRAHQDFLRTQLWTKNRAEPFAQEYERARFTAERYRTEMLPRARRAYQLEVMKYQQMAQPYPKALAAQQLLFTLQLGYITALHNEWSAATELQNYTLEGALDQPMSRGSDDTTRNLPDATGGGN
jgi:cobalt-zinc-cadmium efflux system outer membrane protein